MPVREQPIGQLRRTRVAVERWRKTHQIICRTNTTAAHVVHIRINTRLMGQKAVHIHTEVTGDDLQPLAAGAGLEGDVAGAAKIEEPNAIKRIIQTIEFDIDFSVFTLRHDDFGFVRSFVPPLRAVRCRTEATSRPQSGRV